MKNQEVQKELPVYISTTNDIPGMRVVQQKGLVFGATVRARGVGGDCIATCQGFCGGEVSAYTEMAIDARNEAIMRMLKEAKQRGANAVVGIKFDSENMGGSGSANNGTIAYGTAVYVEPL